MSAPTTNAAPTNAETPNTNGNNIPRSRTYVPVDFKLALIAEVKKHDVIWQNHKEKKNSYLLNDAWQRISKTLRVKKTGFCEKQWKLLLHGYRSHINRKTPMLEKLSSEMAFMEPQLKKSSSDNEPSDNESGEPELPPKNKVHTPKPKKVNKQNSQSETECCEDEKASVAILKLLFASIPSDTMRPVKNTLVQTLIQVMPEVEAKISNHAKQQIANDGNINGIDWSKLDVPAEISKAVWDYKVMKAMLTV